jgi:UDPglucose 6-dehydrogenase
MKIGIMGHGTVGKAVGSYFSGHVSFVYDKNTDNWNDYLCDDVDVVFICVPTPTTPEGQDLSAIRDCLDKIKRTHTLPLVIIKSSILPGTTELLHKEYHLSIVHSPEFLSEATAVADFVTQEHVYVGVPSTVNPTHVLDVFKKLFPFIPIKISNSTAMEMVKYTANCFYATKVAYFNSIFLDCQRLGIEYTNVLDLAIDSMGWIGPMHTIVPGRHGMGYAGKCFPDNMKAMAATNDFIKMVDDYNEKLRKKLLMIHLKA